MNVAFAEPPVAVRAYPSESPRRSDKWLSAGLALLLHAALVFGGGRLLVEEARYGVAAGLSSVEVDLVAAPPAPEAAPAEALAPPVPAVPSPQAETASLPEPPQAAPKPVVSGDGSSPVPGKDATTLRAGAGAVSGASADYLRNPPPRYPEASRRAGEEGVVLLAVSVNRNGRPSSVALSRTSGFPSLDRAAIEAVRRWRFQPARLGGIAVDSEAEVPVRFQLKSNERNAP